MAYALQQLRALIATHPDRAASLEPAVKALEAAIESEPAVCLYRVRTLFEVVHLTIAPRLGVDLSDAAEFPARNSKLIKAMDFALYGHPEAAEIGAAIAKLLGSINGTASALAELSNYANLRHGGSLDWPVLGRQHAQMLGGLCDALVAFLFDVAWSRDGGEELVENDRFEEHGRWNENLDETWGSLSIGEGEYWASQILYSLDRTQYDELRGEWLAEVEAAEEAAAA